MSTVFFPTSTVQHDYSDDVDPGQPEHPWIATGLRDETLEDAVDTAAYEAAMASVPDELDARDTSWCRDDAEAARWLATCDEYDRVMADADAALAESRAIASAPSFFTAVAAIVQPVADDPKPAAPKRIACPCTTISRGGDRGGGSRSPLPLRFHPLRD